MLKNQQRRGRPIKKIPLNAAPITVEDIKIALTEAKVKHPPDEVVESLSLQFSFYKEFFRKAREEREIKRQADLVLDAIKTLEETLPSLRQYHRSVQQSWPFSSSHAESIEKFIPSLDSIKQAAILPPVHESLEDWRWLIAVIHKKELLKPVFGAGYGLSRNGPATRFYSKIIPLVSGNEVTSEAIKSQIGLFLPQSSVGDN